MDFSHLTEIETKYLILRGIKESDLQDLISLRLLKKNNHLTPISPLLEDQLNYYQSYKKKMALGSEIYYKILDKKNPFELIGLVRLTEINSPNKFSWESFIVSDSAPPYIPLDAMMTIYRIGFEKLNKNICGPWTTPINAEKVINLHKKIGMAKEVSQDDHYHHMIVTKEAFFQRYGFFKKIGYGLYSI